jgi:hypothetical protein
MSGRYAEIDGRTVVKFDVIGHGAPVTAVAELLPAVSLPLPAGSSLQGGVASIDVVLQGPLERPTTVGSVVVNNTRLIGFNLEERLSSITGLDLLHINRELEISTFDAHFNAGPGKISVESIDVTMPGIGVFSGSGEVGDDRMIEFRMNAIRSGVVEKHPIPFLVRGACTAPIFRPPGKPG